jgi:hypothetical protein
MLPAGPASRPEPFRSPVEAEHRPITLNRHVFFSAWAVLSPRGSRTCFARKRLNGR